MNTEYRQQNDNDLFSYTTDLKVVMTNGLIDKDDPNYTFNNGCLKYYILKWDNIIKRYLYLGHGYYTDYEITINPHGLKRLILVLDLKTIFEIKIKDNNDYDNLDIDIAFIEGDIIDLFL